jgi:hypothetical protein
MNSGMIQTGSYDVMPSRKTWSHKYSGSTASASSSANVRNQSRLATIKQSPQEETRERERERCLYLDKLIGVPSCLRFRRWPSDVTATLFFCVRA